ncbi:hypothetical protein [Limosilactobacillus mucosae]|uniref:hypothetical protein n=1 Tax=Limosilactobacillus mucosae TaxID=97478 RepID=UPI0039919374
MQFSNIESILVIWLVSIPRKSIDVNSEESNTSAQFASPIIKLFLEYQLPQATTLAPPLLEIINLVIPLVFASFSAKSYVR